MAREVIWSEAAVKDRVDIYRFWQTNNGSSIFSDKLEQLFEECTRILALFPELGVQTDFEEIRVKVIRSYKLFYRLCDDKLEVIRTWDSRQDPNSLRMQR